MSGSLSFKLDEFFLKSWSTSLPSCGDTFTSHWYLLLQAMESKLLVGGKNIVDHTNEQQRMLQQKRQEIAEQVPQTNK